MRLTAAAAVARLKAVFRRALREARRRKAQVFLELFAGVGEITAAWQRDGYGAIRFELSLGDEFDVAREATVKLISGWLRSHCIAGVWLGTP